jgi:tetratricopeptide (TPR) repeat protein
MHLTSLLTAFISIGAFTTLFSADPAEDPRGVLKNLGLAYLEEDMNQEAAGVFEQLTAQVPDEALGWADLGLARLRLGKLDEAAKAIDKAMALAPTNATIRLMQLQLLGRRGDDAATAKAISGALQVCPNDVRIQQAAIDFAERTADPASARRTAIEHYQTIIRLRPGNVYALLQLARAEVENGNAAAAKKCFDALERLPIDWPAQTAQYRQQVDKALAAGDAAGARTGVVYIGNLLKPTLIYRRSAAELKGLPPPSASGEPVTEFLNLKLTELPARAPAIPVKFQEATARLGLDDLKLPAGPVVTTLADVNDDGRMDVVFLAGDEVVVLLGGPAGDGLLKPGWRGGVKGRPAKAGARPGVLATVDLNNDGLDDLVIAPAGGGLEILQQEEKGGFKSVTAQAALPKELSETVFDLVVPLDVEHDGDLDLILAPHAGGLGVLRNNGDGTYAWQPDMFALSEAKTRVVDLDWGDLDDDEDMDVVAATADGKLYRFDNRRNGAFATLPALPGLDTAAAVRVGDMDNDGRFDLVFVRPSGEVDVALQHSPGRFDVQSVCRLDSVSEPRLYVLDYDNDGWLDILVGTPEKAHLFRKAEQGWTDESSRLPQGATWQAGADPAADIDGDGDNDLLLISPQRAPTLLLNEGGNQNHWEAITLKARGQGDKRNNSHGIGSVLEVRAGKLYQKRLVKQDITLVGIGSRPSAEAIRVIWPNGVPQNTIKPQVNQLVRQQEYLKGSCPFLFTWNGEKFEFVTDLLWRSPLGTDIHADGSSPVTNDAVKVSRDQLRPRDGRYLLRVSEELWETIFYDELNLICVDHPVGTEIVVDERFVSPAPPPFEIHLIDRLRPVRRATDDTGHDVLDLISRRDGRYLGGFGKGPYIGVSRDHFVELDLGDWDEPATSSRVRLIAEGSTRSTDTSIDIAMAQGTKTRPEPLKILLPDGKGGWRVLCDNAGFPGGKLKTAVLDLTGAFTGRDHRVRLATNLEVYWDYIAFAVGEPDAKVHTTRLAPAKADLRYRGFSEMVQADDFSPELPIYDQVRRYPRWLDIAGWYTRYGDVSELLARPDDHYVIMIGGDELQLEFPVPAGPGTGQVRDFVLWSDGWGKEGDLNTVEGLTVDPPPFHAMRVYPYDPALTWQHLRREDWSSWHTRYLDMRSFREHLQPR